MYYVKQHILCKSDHVMRIYIYERVMSRIYFWVKLHTWMIHVCCSVLQRVAVCCSVLQCVAVYIYTYTNESCHTCVSVKSHTWTTHVAHMNMACHTATHCNTLQHTATHCNTLQHTALHCNILQHHATNCNVTDHNLDLCTYMRIHAHTFTCIKI